MKRQKVLTLPGFLCLPFQLFYFGFGTAGPAYLWSWPLVLVGQLAVALCFMELAAKFPVAGSVYNWSKQLGSRAVGWSSGWLMLTASIVTLSAVVLAFIGAQVDIALAFGHGVDSRDNFVYAVFIFFRVGQLGYHHPAVVHALINLLLRCH